MTPITGTTQEPTTYETLPGMVWRTTSGQVCGIWWFGEGANKPTLQIIGESWDAFQRALESFGLKMEEDDPEDIKGGHPPEPQPELGAGVHTFRTTRPTKYHWLKKTESWYIEAEAKSHQELDDVLYPREIDLPPKEEFGRHRR